METSMLIARILSVIYLSAAVGGLSNSEGFRKIADDVYKNAALTYVMGLIAVILGSLVVHFHNHWVGNWTVLITLVGWLALIKGIVLIAFPHLARRWSEPFLAGKGLKFFPYVALLLGLLFACFGFSCGGTCPFRG